MKYPNTLKAGWSPTDAYFDEVMEKVECSIQQIKIQSLQDEEAKNTNPPFNSRKESLTKRNNTYGVSRILWWAASIVVVVSLFTLKQTSTFAPKKSSIAQELMHYLKYQRVDLYAEEFAHLIPDMDPLTELYPSISEHELESYLMNEIEHIEELNILFD